MQETILQPEGGAAVRSSDLLGFPPVLDACCGSRMFWFDRKNPAALFMDKRAEQHVLSDGRDLVIAPDQIADFTDMPFPDASFYLVVFDPPHMNSLGANSWLAKKYGRLIGDWRDDIKEGFAECLRVLKPNGTLIFKWNTTDIPLDEVLALAPIPPLFGHTTGRQAKTLWVAFLKPNIAICVKAEGNNYKEQRP
jgi:SAM-dependent methyltransferase